MMSHVIKVHLCFFYPGPFLKLTLEQKFHLFPQISGLNASALPATISVKSPTASTASLPLPINLSTLTPNSTIAPVAAAPQVRILFF